MWNWFGGGNTKARKDAPKNAILELRSQLEMLQKRQRHLQNQMDEQDAAARKYVSASNTTAAKAALRRKKTHEHARDQTLAQIDTLDQQINAIESANINFSTLAAMEQASKAMQQIHGKLTPEKVDETMDKLRDQNALSEEIVNAITQNPLGQTDDAELEDELEELQQEFAEEQMLKTDGVPITDAVHKMPTPSTAEPVSSRRQPVAVEEDDEDAEIRRLQAEMAM